MQSFDELYLKIINEHSSGWWKEDYCLELTEDLKKLYPIEHTFLDLHKIIDETVKAVELTPVPDEVLIEIFKNLSTISKGCFKISYKSIIDIVNDSIYELSDIFVESLKKYANDLTGNLYIIKTTIDDDISEVYSNKTFIKINSILNDEQRSFEFLAELINQSKANGLTIIKREIDIDEYKDCLIFMNESSDNFKDTLEHEFTHFIQKICGYSDKLPKTYKHKIDPSTCSSYCSIIKNALPGISNEYIYSLYQFLSDKMIQDEQHQTIKSMIKFFIRIYENDKTLYFIDHNNYRISQIENLECRKSFRKKWIKNFLDEIESFRIFNRGFLRKYLNKSIEETIDVKLELFSLIYLIVKSEFKEYDIENMIEKEFELFKFRNF